MGDDIEGVSVREYLEATLTRVERALIDEITKLQHDVEYIKTHQLHRGEFDAIIQNIHREVDRVERQGAERITEHKKDILERMAVEKSQTVEGQRRTLVVIGLVITLVTFLINVGLSLILR